MVGVCRATADTGGHPVGCQLVTALYSTASLPALQLAAGRVSTTSRSLARTSSLGCVTKPWLWRLHRPQWGCCAMHTACAESQASGLVALTARQLPTQDEIYLNGAVVLPHKDIKESVLEPGTIIM